MSIIISLKPRNIIRQLPWELDSRSALGLLLMLAIVSLVGWLYLTQASAVTATSYRIDELRLELDKVHNQNAALGLEIAELEALPRIESRAKELGFAPTIEVEYMLVDNYPTSPDTNPDSLSSSYAPLTLQALPAETDRPEPVWWVATLDQLTAWLVGEST